MDEDVIIQTQEQNIDIDFLTSKILEAKQKTAENIIFIGECLCLVKKQLNHGEFTKYLEEKVDFTARTAQKFMKISIEFSNTKTPSFLDSEKLYILTTIPSEAREKFINENNIENMSTRELTKAIQEFKTIIKPKKIIAPIQAIQAPIPDGNTNTPNTIIIAPVVNIQNTTDEWDKTIKLYKEIIQKTGTFYSDVFNSDFVLTELESLLISRFENKELDYNTIRKIIENQELNIPIFTKEEGFQNFINSLDISNSYTHIECIDNSYVTYYSILDKELSYETVVDFSWEENINERQGYIEDNKENILTKDNFTVCKGYIETTEYICLYINQKLFAHYNIEKCDYMDCFKKLFADVNNNLDQKYFKLVEKLDKKLVKEKNLKIEKEFKEAKAKGKFFFEKENECYILDSYNSDQDFIKVYIDKIKILNVQFPNKISTENIDEFQLEVWKGNYKNEIIDVAQKLNYTLNFITDFHVKLKEFGKKLKAEKDKKRKQQEEEYRKYYNGYDFGGTTTKTLILDIFTVEEQKLLKEILEDKELWKKVYRGTAIKIHPDRFAQKGEVEVKKAEEKFKMLNAINQKIS